MQIMRNLKYKIFQNVYPLLVFYSHANVTQKCETVKVRSILTKINL